MGEFGRTPDNPADLRDKAGRDHNTRAMTIWFAGGGSKPGTLVGATDDLGFKAVEDIYRMRDVHATVLHLMGLDDMQLTYYTRAAISGSPIPAGASSRKWCDRKVAHDGAALRRGLSWSRVGRVVQADTSGALPGIGEALGNLSRVGRVA